MLIGLLSVTTTSSNMLIVYGKQNCGQCSFAKNYLDSNNISYDYKQLDKDFTREELKEKAPNARMFPVFSLDGKIYNTLDEVRKQLNN